MENGPDSWSLDDNDYLDQREFYKQQKEIDVVLSSAFDDASDISDVSLSEDENDNVFSKAKTHTNEIDLRSTDFNLNNHHLNTSTPIRPKPPPSSSTSKHYSKRLPTSDYRHNISDLPEEESYFSESESHFKRNYEKVKPFEEDESINSRNQNGFSHFFDKDQISSSLLLENDKLTKQLFSLKGECSNISSNYTTLDKKFSQLFGENKINLDIIEQLQLKVNHLEMKLKNETKTNDNLNKKVHFLQSQVDELEYSLNEHGRSDFVTRTNESHEKVVALLNQRHKNELDRLRSEMEQLSQQLHDKEEEILSKNVIIDRYKASDNSSLPRMSMYKEMFKKELKEEMDKEIKRAKEKNKEEILKSMDQKMFSLKEDWQIKLQEDVGKIIHWMDRNSKGDRPLGGHRGKEGQSNQVGPSVEFVPLQDLCDYLQKSMTEREHRIESQIATFKETKQQLEIALQESRQSCANLSNISDKSQILDELRCDLEKFKQESDVLSQKLRKYKLHYRMLEKKHQEEIELLKNQFGAIFERLQSKSRPKSS